MHILTKLHPKKLKNKCECGSIQQLIYVVDTRDVREREKKENVNKTKTKIQEKYTNAI